MGLSGRRRRENTRSISARYSAAVRVRTVSIWATKHTSVALMPPRATVVLPASMAKIILEKPLGPSLSDTLRSTNPRISYHILPHFPAGCKALGRDFGPPAAVFRPQNSRLLPRCRTASCAQSCKMRLCNHPFWIILALQANSRRFFSHGSGRQMRPFGRLRRYRRL